MFYLQYSLNIEILLYVKYSIRFTLNISNSFRTIDEWYQSGEEYAGF